MLLVLSTVFCRKVADWSIYNTFIGNREQLVPRSNFN
jgi:hypothetical protein